MKFCFGRLLVFSCKSNLLKNCALGRSKGVVKFDSIKTQVITFFIILIEHAKAFEYAKIAAIGFKYSKTWTVF